MEDWLQHSNVHKYADDTTISISHKDQSYICARLEEDAKNILSFMASNLLVANASKTAFMFIPKKKLEKDSLKMTIQVGHSKINDDSTTKILGLNFSNNLKWNDHIFGNGGLLSQLNQTS